jgi:hypothetical protein
MNITDLEKEMLIDIMNGENDGVGMGYSETDGIGLTPEQKGILSSLIKKGLVYNSMDGDPDDTPMYCSCKTDITIPVAEELGFEY